jgi:hypothetical protein
MAYQVRVRTIVPANDLHYAMPCPLLAPAPAVDRVNVRESLFAAAFNGLLQQNLPKAVMHCSKDSGVPYRLPAKLM